MGLERLFTIGAYGYDGDAFRRALLNARVDVLCDIRARRGVRGRQYAWANSSRLQATLAEAGIVYVHLRELAPSASIRAVQHAVDRADGIRKRSRDDLSAAFRTGYAEHLNASEAQAALTVLATSGTRPALFCVERTARACHRSIVADAVSIRTGVVVEHLEP